MNKQEAIERLKEHISAITLYVTEAKLDEEEVENELLNIEAIDMAIQALQEPTREWTIQNCPKCGKFVLKDWIVCPYCGADMRSDNK